MRPLQQPGILALRPHCPLSAAKVAPNKALVNGRIVDDTMDTKKACPGKPGQAFLYTVVQSGGIIAVEPSL